MPVPGPGEVLIRVTAAGVNYVDISRARGTFADGPQPRYLAGVEGAGEVTAVGEGVTAPALGGHVIGVNIGGGAFTEHMVLPAAAAAAAVTGPRSARAAAVGLVPGATTQDRRELSDGTIVTVTPHPRALSPRVRPIFPAPL